MDDAGRGDRAAGPRRAPGAQPTGTRRDDENRLSYLIDDLVVPTWNAAFVYDTETGVQAALEIFEFANSQLLEFRYYDELLDSRARTHLQAAPAAAPRSIGCSAAATSRATTHLHALFIDVNELTDRTENALKMVGDIYAARLFNLVAARLGLARWKASVEDKLETLDDIYRFAVEQTRDLARPLSRADDHFDSGAGAGAVLPRDHDVAAGSPPR